MKKYTQKDDFTKEEISSWSILEEIARRGAQKMLQMALENEIQEYIGAHNNLVDESGKRIVVRNGYLPERKIASGIGSISIKQPRARIRNRDLQEETFTSRILPRYFRRMPSIDNLISVLYLKGISTNNFPTALSAILGEGAKGLSPANIVRLKKSWEDDYNKWAKRDLSNKGYVYFWVDGVHFNIRLEDDKTCILVIIGADKYGKKELVAVSDGYRESKISWSEILLDLKQRGLNNLPELAIGDGALGFWAALNEAFPNTKRQRCFLFLKLNYSF